jgi:2-pyrone-4,6-dicarboxylate lactonase
MTIPGNPGSAAIGGDEPPAAPAYGRPSLTTPGGWDCHTHVCGPASRYPLAPGAPYLPPHVPFETHIAYLDAFGLSSGVVVQPACYGLDNSCVVDACRRSVGRLAGVAAVAETITTAGLLDLRAAGVRAIRLIAARDSVTGKPLAAPNNVASLRKLAPALRETGMHVELWAGIADLPSLLPEVIATRLPVVVEHMGTLEGCSDPGERCFAELLAHLRAGDIWVKLALARNDPLGDPERLRRFHDALIEANPHNLVWGSDWPYMAMDAAPDAARLLDLFGEWVGDAAQRDAILRRNPRRLYARA